MTSETARRNWTLEYIQFWIISELKCSFLTTHLIQMDPHYFYYLSKFVIVDFVGKTANSNANLKHLIENFKHNVLELDIGVQPVPDHLQIEM